MFTFKQNRPGTALAIPVLILLAAAVALPAASYADDATEAMDAADAVANAVDAIADPSFAPDPAGAATETDEMNGLLGFEPSIPDGQAPETPVDAPAPDETQDPVEAPSEAPADAESERTVPDSAPDFGSEPAPEPAPEPIPEPEPAPEPVAPTAEAQTGWIEQDGLWFYHDESGTVLLGEQCIDGQWYYLDPTRGGARTTGFARVPIDSGSGSFKLAYYDADGTRVTGVLTLEGQDYCFSDAGAVTTGFVRYDDDSVHFFDPESGQMQTEAELYVHDAWRLFDESDGSMVTGEQFVNGEWRYYDDFDGSQLTHDQLVERVVSAAQGEVGTPDEVAAGYQDYITALGGAYCPYGPCMSFVLRCFQLAGMLSFPADGFVSCWPHDILDWQLSRGLVSTVPQIGSIAYFWMPDSFAAELGLSANHAELVVDLGPNYVVTIGVLGGVRYNIWYPGLAPAYYGVCIP